MSDSLAEIVKNYPHKLVQAVPPFSAVKVKGKPLYRHFLGGSINDVEIPSHEVEIKALNLTGTQIVTKVELQKSIEALILTVKKGFRQNQVSESWNNNFQKEDEETKYLIGKFSAVVSKGTYIRGIAHDIGNKLGVGACTVNITRTRVGDYTLETSLGLNKL